MNIEYVILFFIAIALLYVVSTSFFTEILWIVGNEVFFGSMIRGCELGGGCRLPGTYFVWKDHRLSRFVHLHIMHHHLGS